MEGTNTNDYGASIKSKYKHNVGDFILFADDDNWYEPDALDTVRTVVQHDLDALYVFQYRHTAVAPNLPGHFIPDLERNGEVEVGNIDTGKRPHQFHMITKISCSLQTVHVKCLPLCCTPISSYISPVHSFLYLKHRACQKFALLNNAGCGVVPLKHVNLSDWTRGSYTADGDFYVGLSESVPRTYMVKKVIYVYNGGHLAAETGTTTAQAQ